MRMDSSNQPVDVHYRTMDQFATHSIYQIVMPDLLLANLQSEPEDEMDPRHRDDSDRMHLYRTVLCLAVRMLAT